MIRVIFPSGTVVIYDKATEATPIMESGCCVTKIHDGPNQFARVIGSCICDDGDGLVLNQEQANMLRQMHSAEIHNEQVRSSVQEELNRKCSKCGCTAGNACISLAENKTCSWVEGAEPPLCNFCAEPGKHGKIKKPKKKKS